MIQFARSLPSILALLFGVAVMANAQHEHQQSHGTEDSAAGLLNNLGSHSYNISTSNDLAQSFFNQGLRLYYAFNHAESIKSFKEAQRLDPDCAMCYWGEGLAWGPNINMPMDEASEVSALDAVARARSKASGSPENERALIEALATRYSDGSTEVSRAELDEAYAKAMRDAHHRFPDDTEIAVLFAEAVMTTMPWDYWDEDRNPNPGIQDALDALLTVIELDPNQPGACHFYIHAVEKFFPEKAVECAERLAALMPGAGHIVHMPGHIYVRIGRYQDAIDANKHAVHADETYIADRRPGMGVYTAGYYPHNYDFMAFAASMIGDCELAIEASSKVRDVIPSQLIGEPGFEFLQHYATRPLQMLVRCNRWNEILTYPQPDSSLVHATAMWHYAQGRAKAATDDPAAARTDLVQLQQILQRPDLVGVRLEPNQALDVLAIAGKVLSGWIAVAESDNEHAIAELRDAVSLEDHLLYGEPPEWSVPVRQDLAHVLLSAGQRDAAMATFREDLERFPKNQVSTDGLAGATKIE